MEFDIFHDIFFEFAAILTMALIIGFLGRRLRQPLIISFIAVGIIVGPYGIDLLQSFEKIHLLAELGIAVLLFVVGLKLDISLIRSSGKVALLTGLGQVIFTSFFGYFIALSLGFNNVISLYIAIALTFSSTIIIVKLLSDKKEIQSLHGQISIGFLIVQDIVVILAMIFISALGYDSEERLINEIIKIIAKGLGLLLLMGILMRYVIPWLTHQMAKSPEMLVLFSMTWAVALAALSDYLGFSKEVGAFLGGVSLASTPYREVISGRLISIRDFLLLFFFIDLGSKLNISLLNEQIWPAMIFSVFVLIGNPLIVMIIMGTMGYRKRTGFLAGLNVAQISEFSLILVALGVSVGHVGDTTLGLVTLVGLITISISTYLILYSHQIYAKVVNVLTIFERKNPYREIDNPEEKKTLYDVIIFGLEMYGSNIAASLEKKGYKVFGVDIDPDAVKRWRKRGRHAQYGDADDPELPKILPKHAQCIISTLPNKEVTISLIKYLKAHGFKGNIVATSYRGRSAKQLEKAGADLILLPFVDATEVIDEKLVSLKKPFNQKNIDE